MESLTNSSQIVGNHEPLFIIRGQQTKRNSQSFLNGFGLI